jgi:hypothetical protein
VTAQKKRDDDLTIDRPERFLRHERAIQKIGVVVLTLFAVAGLAGVFGNGPLAKASVTSGGATVRFERFARQTFRTELDISVDGVNAPTVAVTLPRTFLDRVDMLDLRPPDALKRMDSGVATFEVPAHNGSASLVLHYEPKTYGVLEADVSVGGAQPARVRQIVFF